MVEVQHAPPSIFDSPRCPRCVHCAQVRRPPHSSGFDSSFSSLFFSRYAKPGILARSVQRRATTNIAAACCAYVSRHAPPSSSPSSVQVRTGILWYVHLFVVLQIVLIHFLFMRAFFSRHILAFPFRPSLQRDRRRLHPSPFVATRLLSPSPNLRHLAVTRRHASGTCRQRCRVGVCAVGGLLYRRV